MSLLKIFLSLVLMAVLLWFLALNVDQSIAQLELFTRTFYDVNLVYVLLATFLIGMFIGFFIPVFQVLSARAEVRKFERQNKKLQEELNDLRNVAIEEDLTSAGAPGEEEQSETGESESPEHT